MIEDQMSKSDEIETKLTEVIMPVSRPASPWTLKKPMSKSDEIGSWLTEGIMPVSRPASPWKSGSLYLRTPDGSLIPYDRLKASASEWGLCFVVTDTLHKKQ